jgi:hypothetical protein
MLKRICSLVIILSMILHCASRLGVLSHLYENRFDILLFSGVIKEKPIPVCSSDYDFRKGLKIETADAKHHSAGIIQAQEIDLFLVIPSRAKEFFINSSSDKWKAIDARTCYRAPVFSIFHPPLG